MKKLQDVMANPSGWDSMANYAGNVPEDCWLVVLTQTRDSDCLTESNWAAALDLLGGESDNVQIFRFGHWACGWWEALAVRAGTESESIGADIAERLAGYPVLNEEDLSEREQAQADSVWADCYTDSERLEYIRKWRDQFDFHSYRDLLEQVRGRYFGGYASELIY